MERLPPEVRAQFEKYEGWQWTDFRLAAAEGGDEDMGGVDDVGVAGAVDSGPRRLEDSALLFDLVGTKEAAPDPGYAKQGGKNVIQIRIVAPFE